MDSDEERSFLCQVTDYYVFFLLTTINSSYLCQRNLSNLAVLLILYYHLASRGGS